MESTNEELNNSEPQINRGIELLLRNRGEEESKTFHIKFGKMISFLQREFHFFIEFCFNVKGK